VSELLNSQMNDEHDEHVMFLEEEVQPLVDKACAAIDRLADLVSRE
jgi:hypothetical protein